MAPRLRRPTAKDLLGALLVGFGTIFLSKARPEDHWSTRPGVETIVEAEAADRGDPRRRPRRLPATT